jgi:hypothetical protein
VRFKLRLKINKNYIYMKTGYICLLTKVQVCSARCCRDIKQKVSIFKLPATFKDWTRDSKYLRRINSRFGNQSASSPNSAQGNCSQNGIFHCYEVYILYKYQFHPHVHPGGFATPSWSPTLAPGDTHSYMLSRAAFYPFLYPDIAPHPNATSFAHIPCT